MNDLILAFEILLSIYKDGAYSSIELNRRAEGASNQAIVTRIVYGVLQNDVKLEYCISKITRKRPSKTVTVLLKMGLYCFMYIDSIPRYALVDNTVKICEKYGKRQLKGFVNSTLKNFDFANIELPTERNEKLSVETGVPLWLVKKYVKQYGYEETEKFLRAPLFTKEHIRNNSRVLSKEALREILDKNKADYSESAAGGFFVRNCAAVKELCERGKATFQSATSMLCAQSVGVEDGWNVLDLCSAPGGKAVYLSELADVRITACDIHEHRLDLIRAYVGRMAAKNIDTVYNDARVYNKDFEDKFDATLCDVPCSGLGVASKKPDIYLNASEQKISELSDIQYEILCNASRYTKRRIVYSTCTTLREENYNIVGKFVKENDAWKIVSHKQYLPDGQGQDGFFIAVLEKK